MSDMFLLVILNFLSFSLLWFCILRRGTVTLSAISGFVLFFTVQYGPHTVLNDHYFRYSNGHSGGDVDAYYASLVSFFCLLASLFLLILPRGVLMPEYSGKGRVFFNEKLGRRILLVCATSLVLLSLALGGGEIVYEHVKFMASSSAFTYTELRRELFSDSAWAAMANLYRFSILPLISGGLFLLGLRSRSKFLIFFAFLVPLITAIQLNKFFYVYYGALWGVVYFQWKKGGISISAGSIQGRHIGAIFAVFAFMYALKKLYAFQYSAEIDSGLVSADAISDTLIYRIFFASSDALRLWIDYFWVQKSPVGVQAINKLCSIFESSCLDANVFIPVYYGAGTSTTMQSGFIGTGVSVGGFLAVCFFSLLVLVVCCLNNYVLSRFSAFSFFYVLNAVFFVNAFFLTTRDFTTALLSGGALTIAMFSAVFMKYKFSK